MEEEGTLPKKGMSTLGNHEAGSVASEYPTGAWNGIPHLYPLLHAVELFPGQGIYSLPQI